MRKTSKTPTAITAMLATGILIISCACAAGTPTPRATALPTDTPAPAASPTLYISPTATVPTLTPTPTETPTLAESPTPAPTATSITPAFELLLLTSPVLVSGNARVQIQTTPGTECYLSYTTPSGTDSSAKGLGATTAAANGVCAWSWNIGPRTRPGTGRIAITANGLTQYFDIVIQ